ncbi:MAG: TonB-dependent receptor [Chitinophagaceae bacterium]|nr:TonB-dependent receptor [Chitinophagaceae bacterium]
MIPPIKRTSLLVLFIFFSVLLSRGQILRGKVVDAATGEPLVGAIVGVRGANSQTIARLDGSFQLKGLKPGRTMIEARFAGYKSSEYPVTLAAGNVITLDISLVETSVNLESVIVTSDKRDKDKAVRGLERTAEPVMNILSSKTIQLLPDITVANALQRVSGVTIERSSSGEGRYPIIRGMEKRYINTLVNGIKIPSPDNKNRYIPLDLFPSELLERLEVTKSLTPSMEGDAIGGTINLVMKDAPMHTLLQVNASTGYNTSFLHQRYDQFSTSTIAKQSPNEARHDNNYISVPGDFSVKHLNYSNLNAPRNTTVGITYGSRFGAHKQFGLIVSGSYQDIFKGTSSTFFLPNAQPGLNNIPVFVELQSRRYSVESKRSGLNLKLDWEPGKHTKISWTNTFVRLDDYQARTISDTIALNSLVDVYNRSTWQYQSIFNTTLQGRHTLAGASWLDWSLAYSAAANHIPDQTEFSHEYPVATHTPDILAGLKHIWLHNNDKDYSAYLNYTRDTKFAGRALEYKFGILARDRHRENFYNSYGLKPQLSSGSSTQLYTDINNAAYIFNPASAGAPGLNGNNYTFSEQITAAYLQVKWQLDAKLEALGGVREEFTNQHYETQLGPEIAARAGTIRYSDWLPSVQLKYSINKTQNLRLAYYKSLARPGFAEMIPDGPDGEYFKELGNPQSLNHTTADNFDLRYEIYPGSADQVLLGVFYKRISDPIEYSAVKTGVTSLSLIPNNFGDATNYGFEAVLTKYFGVFGVSANYTYTQSKITTNKLFSFRNSAGQITSRIDPETRPLQGQSNHIGNLSLIYKNAKNGLDMQLAFVYTGERVSLVSPYYGLDYWQAPTSQLDFSFEKRVAKKFSVYGKANNLTNSPLQLELHRSYNDYLASSGSRALALPTDPDKKIIVQKDYFKINLLIGARYKF